jgi:hypothetical protein
MHLSYSRVAMFVAGLGVVGACVVALGFGSQSATWSDPSPHQVRRVTVDSSVLLEVLEWGGAGRPVVLLGCYCKGQILTMFAAQHSDRLLGLVYLDGASDPTMTPADVGALMPDPATKRRRVRFGVLYSNIGRAAETGPWVGQPCG